MGRRYQYLALATWLHEFFDFSRGCVHVTPDEVRFRVRYFFHFLFSIFSADILRSSPLWRVAFSVRICKMFNASRFAL